MLLVQGDQFDAALKYLGKVGDEPIDWRNFEEEHGVGVKVWSSLAWSVSSSIMLQLTTVMHKRNHEDCIRTSCPYGVCIFCIGPSLQFFATFYPSHVLLSQRMLSSLQ